MPDKKFLIFGGIAVAIFLFFVALATFLYLDNVARINSVDTFEECAAMGGPILESYPEQCIFNGKNYTRTLTPEEQERLKPPSYPESYYGSSSKAACNTSDDCIVRGCNTEICMGKDEEGGFSVCIAPDQPIPSALGYSCGCVKQRCEWDK